MKKFRQGLTRRRFIQQTGGLFTATLAWPLASCSVPSKPDTKPITKAIPKTGEQLPVIGMGTSRTFDVGNNQKVRAQLAQVLQTFFDHGGAVIDSSPMYGNAEQVVGDLLATTKNTQRLFTATKVWTWGRQEGIDQMLLSMQRMGVDRIDLMQIHNLRDWQVQLETLQAWKSEGKIRYIGITTSHQRQHDELEVILETEPLDFVQFSYNIANRKAEQRLLPIAAERNIAVLVNRPFQRGDLFRKVQGKSLPDWAGEFDCQSWAQFFLKYIVSQPQVTCAIPATRKESHMVDNMAAGFGRLPDAAMRKRMESYFETV
ncbi:MAG: aldo/keto reductase [Proteobacteria bacterium]|jgi:diketogulonate reductase-like aldo/keto reductase|nr:aldo/keto reductase [Pseudomonadota bacterium]